MSYKIEDKGEVTVITPYLSRATMEYALDFKEYILTAIENGKSKIVVDLSMSDFIDSTFLGVLVFALKKIKDSSGFVKLVITGEMPLGMLQQTRMDKVFKIYSDIDTAIVN